MSRLAVLHRERAALFAKLAELEAEIAAEHDPGGGRPANDERPTRRRRRPNRPIVVPPQDVSDTDVQRAVDAAKRRGIMVGR